MWPVLIQGLPSPLLHSPLSPPSTQSSPPSNHSSLLSTQIPPHHTPPSLLFNASFPPLFSPSQFTPPCLSPLLKLLSISSQITFLHALRVLRRSVPAPFANTFFSIIFVNISHPLVIPTGKACRERDEPCGKPDSAAQVVFSTRYSPSFAQHFLVFDTPSARLGHKSAASTILAFHAFGAQSQSLVEIYTARRQ